MFSFNLAVPHHVLLLSISNMRVLMYMFHKSYSITNLIASNAKYVIFVYAMYYMQI